MLNGRSRTRRDLWFSSELKAFGDYFEGVIGRPRRFSGSEFASKMKRDNIALDEKLSALL